MEIRNESRYNPIHGQTWTIPPKLLRRLNAAEMSYWIRSLNVKLRVRNDK